MVGVDRLYTGLLAAACGPLVTLVLTVFDYCKHIREAIVAIPVEVTDLQIMAACVVALKECEASRIKHSY